MVLLGTSLAAVGWGAWLALGAGALIALLGARLLANEIAKRRAFQHVHVHVHPHALPHAHPHPHDPLHEDHHHVPVEREKPRLAPLGTAAAIALSGAMLIGEGFVALGVVSSPFVVIALTILAICAYAFSPSVHPHARRNAA